MKKIITILLSAVLLIPAASYSQHTFTSGMSSLEISGYLITYYQYRPHYKGDPKTPDLTKNSFVVDDARLKLKGYIHGNFRYDLEVNFADIVPLIINGISGIKSSPLTECHISYINPYVNIKAGYMKVPFSWSSNMDKIHTPYLQRTLIADGDYYSRRDAGVLLYRDFWHQRIVASAGIYSGMGEYILLGANDASGKFEYVAHLQLCTSHYREEEFDYNNLALPLAQVSGDFRYAEKNSYSGNGTSDFALDNVKTIDGKKWTYGMNAGFMWHGFSAQFEMAQAHMKPHANTPLHAQLAEFGTDYYRNGGYLVQVNYYCKQAMSGISVRYDEFNPSDLLSGISLRTLGMAYNFIWPKYHVTVKAHYAYRLKEQANGVKWKEDQLRVGAVYTF